MQLNKSNDEDENDGGDVEEEEVKEDEEEGEEAWVWSRCWPTFCGWKLNKMVDVKAQTEVKTSVTSLFDSTMDAILSWCLFIDFLVSHVDTGEEQKE